MIGKEKDFGRSALENEVEARAKPVATKAARIPLPSPDTMNAAQMVVFEAIVNGRRGSLVGPLRAALHNPVLADRWQKFGEVLRYDTSFPSQASELAILITARRWNCELEWVIHREAAREAGLPDAVVDAIRHGRVPAFEDPDLANIYRFVSELQNAGQVSDDIHAKVTGRWGALGVVELTAITGYYSMVSMTLNAHRIPLPQGREPELYLDGDMPASGLSNLPVLAGESRA